MLKILTILKDKLWEHKLSSVLIAGFITLGTGVYQQNRQFQRSVEQARTSLDRKLLIHLVYFKDDLEHNVTLLRNRQQFTPVIRIYTMEKDRDALLKQAPMLNLLYFVYLQMKNEEDDARAFLKSEYADDPKYQYNVLVSKRKIESAQVLAKAFHNFELASLERKPEEELRLSFTYNATKDDVIYEWPIDLAIEIKQLYHDLWYIDHCVDEILELTSKGGASDSVFSAIMPLPSNVAKVKQLQADLDDRMAKLKIEKLEALLNRVTKLIEIKRAANKAL